MSTASRHKRRQLDFNAARRSLLVVDDEPAIRGLIAKLFAQKGFTVFEAEDVMTAVEILNATPVSVLLIDKNLSGGTTGLDLLPMIPSRAPHAKAIIITAYASTDSAVSALKEGAYDYITKPFKLEDLEEKVEQAVVAYVDDHERAEMLDKHGALFETVPDLVWFMTENGIIKRINATGANLLGYTPEDLEGSSYQRLLAGGLQDPAVHWAFKERRTGARATRRVVAELRTSSGETRLFEVYSGGAYVRGSGDRDLRQLWGTVGVAHDITEQTLMREELHQARKMEALGRLAGGVAHDFNNMLSVIINNVEFITERLPGDSPILSDLKEVEEAGRRAAEMSRQLLAFSRKEPAEPRVIDLADTVERALTMLRRLIGENIDCSLRRGSGPHLVTVDPAQIHQILLNLAANGRDAMPGGGVLTIDIGAVTLDDAYAAMRPGTTAGEYVMLAVSDTGSGMSPEVRQHVFEPFYTTKEAARGTGLGLSTVYGIVCQCEGQITIYSEESVGTTVKIYLPHAQGERAAPSDVVPPPRVITCEGTVLLVEDEELVRKVAQRALTGAGVTVLEAANSEEALRIFASSDRPIDLLVTDLVMPGMSGLELARTLRERQGDLKIIYMSGYLGAHSGDESMLASGTRFLQKPFTVNGFLGQVSQLLGPKKTGA